MSYLRFDKTLMTNLEESLQREILRTNKAGAYHCTTIVDCNTRKYHGLLYTHYYRKPNGCFSYIFFSHLITCK